MFIKRELFIYKEKEKDYVQKRRVRELTKKGKGLFTKKNQWELTQKKKISPASTRNQESDHVVLRIQLCEVFFF